MRMGKAVIIREIKIWIAFHREPTIEISLREPWAYSQNLFSFQSY